MPMKSLHLATLHLASLLGAMLLGVFTAPYGKLVRTLAEPGDEPGREQHRSGHRREVAGGGKGVRHRRDEGVCGFHHDRVEGGVGPDGASQIPAVHQDLVEAHDGEAPSGHVTGRVVHDEMGPGWVWGSGSGVVTVRCAGAARGYAQLRVASVRVFDVLGRLGFKTEIAYSHWLAKAFNGDRFIDIIFNSGNGVAEVDDEWFAHAVDHEVLGVPVKLCPAEEMIWSKALIMERERFDGADVAHLIRHCSGLLNWDRLVRRFNGNWRVLLAHLILFGFIYPGERSLVPSALMKELVNRLLAELDVPTRNSKVCQGTLLSRQHAEVRHLEDAVLGQRRDAFKHGGEFGDPGVQAGKLTPEAGRHLIGGRGEVEIAVVGDPLLPSPGQTSMMGDQPTQLGDVIALMAAPLLHREPSQLLRPIEADLASGDLGAVLGDGVGDGAETVDRIGSPIGLPGITTSKKPAAIAVSVAAGPVPVLAHEIRIRRLAMAGQRVNPDLAGAGFRRNWDRNCSAA